MVDNKTKEVYLRSTSLKRFLKCTIMYNDSYILYESTFDLDDYSLLYIYITSDKGGIYTIELELLKKYNLKGI